MNIINKRSISILIILVVLIGFCFKKYNTYMNVYMNEPVKVNFEKIATLNIKEDLKYDKWLCTIIESKDVKMYEETYGITIPQNDFDKDYLYLVGGYELQDLSYIRKDSKPTEPRLYFANAKYKSEFQPRNIYIYRVGKLYLTEQHW